jgi:hypothetical protein
MDTVSSVIVAWLDDIEAHTLKAANRAGWKSMRRVARLELEIESLSPEELAEFRAWFLEFDSGRWNAQLESDVPEGRLDQLADEALREHQAGRTRPI